jgi:triacylglycerol lipase
MNIVLAHGILGFSNIGPINYFNGIADHLRLKPGALVYAVKLDKTAGTRVRSKMLRESIQAALDKGELDRRQPIHIIAHSMGGLDSRRLIAEDPTIQGIPVRTLATIGTPHRGSPIADLVALDFVPPNPLLRLAALALADVLQRFGVSLEGLHDLTTGAARDFNTQFHDRDGVKYLSYGGKGRPGIPASAFFLACHQYIQLLDGEQSDGVVPVSSSPWTGFDPNYWPADHADEIGYDLNIPAAGPTPELLARYDAIVTKFDNPGAA